LLRPTSPLVLVTARPAVPIAAAAAAAEVPSHIWPGKIQHGQHRFWAGSILDATRSVLCWLTAAKSPAGNFQRLRRSETTKIGSYNVPLHSAATPHLSLTANRKTRCTSKDPGTTYTTRLDCSPVIPAASRRTLAQSALVRTWLPPFRCPAVQSAASSCAAPSFAAPSLRGGPEAESWRGARCRRNRSQQIEGDGGRTLCRHQPYPGWTCDMVRVPPLCCL